VKPPKRYTVADIKDCVDLLRDDKEISQEKIAGMDFLVQAIDTFEKFDDMPEAEMKVRCRNAHREWDREKVLEKMAAQEAKKARKRKRLAKTDK